MSGHTARDDGEHKRQESEAYRATIVGAGCNVGLAGLKAIGGIYGGSTALLADATHSLTDLLSDVVTLVAVKLGRSPADEDHPYGHGKFEAIGSLSVGGIILASGVGLGGHSYDAVLNVIASHAETPIAHGMVGASLGAAIASIACKEALYRWTYHVGTACRSSTVVANAWHHRSDAFSSVVATVGIVGSAAGSPLLDPIAAILVSAMVVRTGGHIVVEAVGELTDQIGTETLTQIADAAEQVEGVVGTHNVRARKSGASLLVDMSCVVAHRTTVSSAYWITERVRERVRDAVEGVSDVVIHVEPSNYEQSRRRLRRQRAESLISEDVVKAAMRTDGVTQVSPVQVHYDGSVEGVTCDVNIYVDADVRVRDTHAIARRARENVLRLVDDVADVDMHLELDSRFSPDEARPVLEDIHGKAETISSFSEPPVEPFVRRRRKARK